MKVIPVDGTVSLSQKKTPVSTRGAVPNYPLIVTRAKVDISKFKQTLDELPPEIWEDENQEGNVKLTRPAHDKWGIKKIVFTFCDDFMLKVLDLPWSMEEKWESLLLPIYAALGIDRSKVVRSLLASMPPGVTIPVHHDTGEWVKYTHRIHVPICTGDEVEFLCGPNESAMLSYAVEEGSIIELNNQSKHAVTNNWTRNRVHLIFDYVEDYPIKRYTLKPGQVMRQTRRSIDFDPADPLCDEAEKPTEPVHPRFLIIGAQKCGTTSLYEYMAQHPLVVKGRRRETHYFDWRWNPKIETSEAQLDYYMNFYHAELAQYPSLMTGESTPSYLLHSDVVIPRVRSVLPFADVRFLVMLRNPVARAYSQYHMAIDETGTPEQMKVRGLTAYIGKSFSEVVEEEIASLTADGITPDCSYERFCEKVLAKCPMTHGGHSIIARGMYALQLEPWLENFGEQMKILSLTDIKGSPDKVQDTLNSVFDFVGLPPADVADTEAKNSRSYPDIDPQVKQRLDDFYQPFNERLFALIGRTISW